MKDEDAKKMQEMLRAMFEAFMGQDGIQPRDRYCQRCEEPRKGHQFTTLLPVCDICAETMPKQEIIELSNRIR